MEKENKTQKFIDNPEKLKELKKSYLEEIKKDPKAYSIASKLINICENIKGSSSLTHIEFNLLISKFDKIFTKIDDFRKNGLPESYRNAKKLIFISFPEEIQVQDEIRWFAVWAFEYAYCFDKSPINQKNPFFKIFKKTCIH